MFQILRLSFVTDGLLVWLKTNHQGTLNLLNRNTFQEFEDVEDASQPDAASSPCAR